ncbi:MAG: ExbD/TolR family protein [Candidatus Nitrospinota bacterium M3_3B_026]
MRFRKPEEEDYSLSLTPLIDVVFLLLIFFMVSTAFIDFTRRMDIELPESRAGAAAEKTRVYEIEMTKDGDIFLNGEAVVLEALPDILKADTGKAAAKSSVIIRADRRLDYGAVVEVMGICREAGILDIGAATR